MGFWGGNSSIFHCKLCKRHNICVSLPYFIFNSVLKSC
jgi:hypothetical protein